MECAGRTGSAGLGAPIELVDPPFVDGENPRCGCQHVDAANALHCLQSIERSGPAQGEGFAQFYASRGWNTPTEADCTFVYYKEFLDTNCHANSVCTPVSAGGTTLQSNLPPVRVDCANPVKWRNTYCPVSEAAEFGTELDWMQFYYSLNTNPQMRFPMSDIFLMYRHACNPPAPGQPPTPDPARCAGQQMLWDERAPLAPVNAQTCSVNNRACPQDQACFDVSTDQSCTANAASCVCKFPGGRGLTRGAEIVYANNLPAVAQVRALGDAYGVSRSLQ
jgi:hypothetical protein